MSRRCDRPIVGFDTEDGGGGPSTVISAQFVAEDGARAYIRRGRSLEAFYAACDAWLSRRPASDLWAANMAYDANNLGLFSRGARATKTARGYTSWTHPRLGEHVLYDTGAIVKFSVATMGALVGLEKLAFNPEDEAYAMRDAEIVLRFVQRLRAGIVELHENATLRPTSGATAKDVWRCMGGTVSPLPPALMKPARDAYRGGRTEVFRFDASDRLEVYDIRSAFPWAMRRGSFPAGDWRPTREIVPEGLYEARVRVEGPIGALPVRCDGVNVYPVGTFTGLYYGEELSLPGVKILKLRAGWNARDRVDPFNLYVDKLWNARRAPAEASGLKPASALAAKELLVALYGVMGFTGKIGGLATIDVKNRTLGQVIDDAEDLVAWKHTASPGRGSNPVWSGLVTARVRARLHRAMLEHVEHLVYVDTDALFLAGRSGGASPQPTGDGLGDWRFDAEASAIDLVAPKIYALRSGQTWEYVANGVPKANAAEYVRTLATRFEAPVTILQAACRARRKKTAGAWREVEKTVQKHYRARRVHVDGRTSAWDASELPKGTASTWAV